MASFNGNIIYKSKHPDGDAIIAEHDSTRYLYLGSGTIQSAMNLQKPNELKLTYTQSMMGFLLLTSPPKRCLSLGLGGGALVKYLLTHQAAIHIDTVEIRQDIIDLAHSHFFVPRDNRLNIYANDAHQFIQQKANNNEEGYDVIFVDAYDQHGLASSIERNTFFDNCLQLLNPNGVLALNMWASSSHQLKHYIEQLHLSSDSQPLCLPVAERGNVIVFVSKKILTTQGLKHLKKHAIQLEKQFNLPFTGFLRDLIKHNNHNWLQRLFNKVSSK